jgi:hypothetical protein
MKKALKIWISLLLVLGISACTQNEDTNQETPTGLESYEITLAANDFLEVYTAQEIMDIESETLTMTNISSSGEVATVSVTGIKLNQLLNNHDLNQNQFSEATISAKDSYSMVVPAEIVQGKDIYIIWELDGEALQEPHAPLRIAIADERSMYWVGQIDRIEFAGGTSTIDPTLSSEITRVLLVDNSFKLLESEEVTYYEDADQAVYVKGVLDYFNIELDERDISMVATDEFEKDEKTNVFKEGMIKYTGENAPLFFALDMPKGMHVKNMMKLSIYNDELIFLSSVFSKYEDQLVEVNEVLSLPYAVIKGITNLEASENYVLVASDGYEKEVTQEMMDVAYLYEEDGVYNMHFDGYESKEKVKDIVIIKLP